MDKARNRWMADQARAQREADAAAKEAQQAERAKQREREAAEEAIVRAQEALEAQLEKHSVRRSALGADRHHRRYWWGLAGHRPALMVEDAEGQWAMLRTLGEVEALMESLDARGVREAALAAALARKLPAMSLAMRRAAAAAEKERPASGRADKERERPAPGRRSERATQQVEFFDPSLKPAAAAAKPTGLAALFGPSERAAVEVRRPLRWAAGPRGLPNQAPPDQSIPAAHPRCHCALPPPMAFTRRRWLSR